jgi:hypothetical protein
LFLYKGIQTRVVLSVEISSNKQDIAQAYYDNGSKLSEAASTRTKLKGTGAFESIHFDIPAKNLRSIRFDPLTQPGSFQIRSMKLRCADSTVMIPLENLKPSVQIASMEMKSGVLHVETVQDGKDPQLTIILPERLPFPQIRFAREYMPLLITAVLLLIASMFLFFVYWYFPVGRSEFCIMLGIFFIIFTGKLFLISQHGSLVPYFDQWAGEAKNLLIPFLNGKLSWDEMLAPHNEHRILFTRLFVLGQFTLNGIWEPIQSMTGQAFLHAGVMMIFLAICRSFLEKRAWIFFAFVVTILTLIPFSWENTLWGFQSQFYFTTLFGLIGIYATWKHVPLSPRWVIGWLALFLGLFSMASGVFAAATVFFFGVFRLLDKGKISRSSLVTGSVMILLVVILGLYLHESPARHEPLKAQNIREFVVFFSRLASWPTSFSFLGLIFQLPIIILIILVLLKRPARTDASWLLATLGSWSLLGIAALAFSRANSGLASRYTDVLILGLLLSLSSILYFIRYPARQVSRLAKGWLLVFLICIAAGSYNLYNTDLKYSFHVYKTLEPVQARHLISYMHSEKVEALRDKPFLHIPILHPEYLTRILPDKKLQKVLPPILNPGLPPGPLRGNDSAFILSGGIVDSLRPTYSKPHYSSYARSGNENMGELRLDFDPFPATYEFEISVAGYPLARDMQLYMETDDGEKIPIPVQSDPKGEWQKAVIKNSGKSFSIVAVDGSPTSWLAVGLPIPVGRLSYPTSWLLSHWWIFIIPCIVCFGLALISDEQVREIYFADKKAAR